MVNIFCGSPLEEKRELPKNRWDRFVDRNRNALIALFTLAGSFMPFYVLSELTQAPADLQDLQAELFFGHIDEQREIYVKERELLANVFKKKVAAALESDDPESRVADLLLEQEFVQGGISDTDRQSALEARRKQIGRYLSLLREHKGDRLKVWRAMQNSVADRIQYHKDRTFLTDILNGQARNCTALSKYWVMLFSGADENIPLKIEELATPTGGEGHERALAYWQGKWYALEGGVPAVSDEERMGTVSVDPGAYLQAMLEQKIDTSGQIPEDFEGDAGIPGANLGSNSIVSIAAHLSDSPRKAYRGDSDPPPFDPSRIATMGNPDFKIIMEFPQTPYRLTDEEITELSQNAQLAAGEELEIENRILDVTSFDQLSRIYGLKALALGGCEIPDFDRLEKLPELESLYLEANTIPGGIDLELLGRMGIKSLGFGEVQRHSFKGGSVDHFSRLDLEKLSFRYRDMHPDFYLPAVTAKQLKLVGKIQFFLDSEQPYVEHVAIMSAYDDEIGDMTVNRFSLDHFPALKNLELLYPAYGFSLTGDVESKTESLPSEFQAEVRAVVFR